MKIVVIACRIATSLTYYSFRNARSSPDSSTSLIFSILRGSFSHPTICSVVVNSTVYITKCAYLLFFTVCDVCEKRRAALKDSIVQKRSEHDLVRRKKKHITMVGMERLEYEKKRHSAIMDSS